MTQVLIIEDHQFMCDSLRELLEKEGTFQVAGTAVSADLAEVYCEKLHPELVLMDVCTEGGSSGISAAKRLRERWPDMKIIVMTGFDEVTYLPRAKAAGANGFLYKSRSLSSFLETVNKVMAGENCFGEPKTIPLPEGEKPLSDREMEILRLICSHMTTKEIAEELYISENTVKSHKSNILQKTGFSNTLDLAFYLITNGWINPRF